MAKQMGEILARPGNPFFSNPPPGYQRGIDFYPAAHLLKVVALSAGDYKRVHGAFPNLVDPVRLTEKISWAKLFRSFKVPQTGNKLETGYFVPHGVRDSVAVPEVVWRSREARLPPPDDIEAGTFYLKTNHGSGLFKRIQWPPPDEERLRLEREFAGHLTKAFGYRGGEWWYNCFDREIFLERNVSRDPHSIAWCCYTFGGNVRFIIAYRKHPEGDETLWLNPDFTPSAWQSPSKRRTQPAMPTVGTQEKILAAAEAIGRRFSFVRVDFLLGDDEQIYVSELTFAPSNAMTRWPPELDLQLGAYWKTELPNRSPAA